MEMRKLLSGELGRGTIILFLTMNFVNFLNFLIHFSMGRMLGAEDYGTFAVLMSMIFIYNIPTEAIQNIISRYTSTFNLKEQKGKIKFLMRTSLKKGFVFSCLAFAVSMILALFLSKFLKINFWLILITNITIFASFSSPITRGVLQGRKKFGSLGNSLLIASTLKLFFAVSLVILGFKVFGAITGTVVGIFAGLVFSFYFNKDILSIKEEKTSFDRIYSKSIPYFNAMFAILLMFSLDIIFAKRFFSAELAGKYAVLSMIGKIIFLGTIAVGTAMFPLTSEKSDTKKDSSGLFKKSLLIVILLCIIAVIIYALFPELIIKILYGSKYIDMAPYLIYSGIAFSFLSLSNLVLIYGLSMNRLRKSMYLFIFLGIEIVLFYLFHKTILEYILAFMVSNIIMFIGSFLFIRLKIN